MGASLDINGQDGKPTVVSNIPAQKAIRCPYNGCEISYTLSYTGDEYRMVGSENNVAIMERKAVKLIEKEHPVHSTKTFMWKAIGNGPECEWRAADSLAARKGL